jgi:hypothetical protein
MTKATNTRSEYVTLIVLPLQQWLQDRASLLRHTYIACLVFLQPIHSDSGSHTTPILGILEVLQLGPKRTERFANYCPPLVPKMKYTFTKTPNLKVGCSVEPFPRKDKIHVQGLWVPWWG